MRASQAFDGPTEPLRRNAALHLSGLVALVGVAHGVLCARRLGLQRVAELPLDLLLGLPEEAAHDGSLNQQASELSDLKLDEVGLWELGLRVRRLDL